MTAGATGRLSPLNTLEQVPRYPSPLPSLPLSPPFPSPLPSPPLRSRPPYCGQGVWGSALAPPAVRQTVFGEFQAKNLASSSNDLQELFRK